MRLREQLPHATLARLLHERGDDQDRRIARASAQERLDQRALRGVVTEPAAEGELELGVVGDQARRR